MLTQDELDRIAARVSAATPGPWHAAPGDERQPISAPQLPKVTNKGYLGATAKRKSVPIVSLGNHGGCSDPECCADIPFVQVSERDAEFIAAARSDIPRLLEEIRRLRGENEPKVCEICGMKGTEDLPSRYRILVLDLETGRSLVQHRCEECTEVVALLSSKDRQLLQGES